MAEFLPPTASKFSQVSHKVFEYIGYSGRFHTSAFIVANLALFGCCTSLFVVTFAAPDPTTKCASQSDPTGFTTCPESQACALRDQGQPYLIKFDYDNWTQQYNMVCENAGKRQFAKSLFIFMNVVFIGTILFLSDILGRKVGFLLMFISCCVGCCLGTFADDYTLKLFGYGMSTASSVVFGSLFTIAFSELLPSESTSNSKILLLVFAANPFGLVLFALSYKYVTTSPTVLAWVTLVTTVVTSFLPVVVMPESLSFLFRKKRIPEFCQVVKEIRGFNEESKSMTDNDIQQAAQELAGESDPFLNTNPKSEEVMKVLSWDFFVGFCKVLPLFTVTSLIFWALTLNPKLFGADDIGTNSIIFYSLNTLSCVLFDQVSKRFSIRQWLVIFMAVELVGGVLLVVFGKMGMLEGNNTGQKLLNLFITVGIIGIPSFVIFAPSFVYISQVFPREVVGTATSLIFIVSNVFCIAAPQIVQFSQEKLGHFASAAALSAIVPLIILANQASSSDR